MNITPGTSTDEPREKKFKLQPSESSEITIKKDQQKMRIFSKIPIFIVDYHNDVLEFIYRCFGSRHLPLYNNTIIHFDSHPDMVISRDIDPEIIFDKNKLLDTLSIENWIMPTCYAGHFKKIIWIKNSWCKQIDCGEYKFNIGDYNNELCVDFPIPYFISEGNYCANENLNNKKEIKLNVMEIDQVSVNSNNSSSISDEEKEEKNYQMDKKQKDIENVIKLINNNNFILDIDLDYFSTANPFLNIYEKINCYKRITEIFNYTINENNFENDYQHRKIQLDILKEIFQYLEEHRTIDESNELLIENNIIIIKKILELVRELKDNYNDNQIDWILIYNAGCTSDNKGLPHYISSDEILNIYFNNFKNFLQNLNLKPIAITISRSSEDGYCPSDKVDFIQENILKILQFVYGKSLNNKPILWYEEEAWDIMKL